MNKKFAIPGPGTYDELNMTDKYGVYKLSTLTNSKAANWSPSKQRFPGDCREKAQVPAPGHYNPSDQVGSQYLLSNFKNYGSKVYKPLTKKKMYVLQSDTPGPGTYRVPSDFGYLDLGAGFNTSTSTTPRATTGTANQINRTIA